jgi:hypothetical protein
LAYEEETPSAAPRRVDPLEGYGLDVVAGLHRLVLLDVASRIAQPLARAAGHHYHVQSFLDRRTVLVFSLAVFAGRAAATLATLIPRPRRGIGGAETGELGHRPFGAW